MQCRPLARCSIDTEPFFCLFLLSHPRLPIYLSFKSGPDTKNGTHNGVVQKPVVMRDEERARTFIQKRAWALDQAMRGELVPQTKKKWNCSYCPVVQQCEAIRE